METAYNRLLTALRTGAELTAKQISARFSVAQPYDLVYRMRENGFNVKMIERTNSKGQTKGFYRLVQNKNRRKAA